MYFIGVVLSTVTAPPLADAFGRKMVIFGSNLVLITGLIGLLLSSDIYELYVFEALVGFSFGGLIIVGLNYLLEY